MAILAFQKPDKVIMLEESPTYGKFEFRPLEPGFGITVGNALRRILLSSLDGYAINTIRIEGVEHEFASVPGAREDVTNIILNLKQVRFKRVVKDFDGEKVSITIENSSEFKAGDIGNYLTGFEVLNPDLVICHLDSKASMKIDLTINKGRGYVPAEDNRQFCTDVNVLPIDSIYTPIRNVKYEVDNYRVEQKTDYEKLVIEVTTDGSIQPKEALRDAAKILIQHFMLEFPVWISDILRPIFTVFLHLLHRHRCSHIGPRKDNAEGSDRRFAFVHIPLAADKTWAATIYRWSGIPPLYHLIFL